MTHILTLAIVLVMLVVHAHHYPAGQTDYFDTAYGAFMAVTLHWVMLKSLGDKA